MRLRNGCLLLMLLGLSAWSGAAPPENRLTIAQLQYDGGGDWYANPSGLPNLLKAIKQRTGLQVNDRPAKIKATDPSLWEYPYLYLTGHGNIRFSDEEVHILRRYLTTGGFLHADDNYGLDSSFRREIKRIFPDNELVELPSDHPIYRAFYKLPKGLPKIHKHDGKAAQGFAVVHEGRVVVFYSYESDLGNGWEDAALYDDPPQARESALRMGVNLFVYALSQAVAP
jgi:uncharacterized protein DUF4159